MVSGIRTVALMDLLWNVAVTMLVVAFAAAWLTIFGVFLIEIWQRSFD